MTSATLWGTLKRYLEVRMAYPGHWQPFSSYRMRMVGNLGISHLLMDD